MHPRKIIHIDADCFFAAIEMRDNPRLKDIPFAVGGSPSGRGVLTTCNYPARVYGVRSAMPTAQALKLCPQLTVGPVNMSKYRAASQQMREIFERYTEIIEPLSLDEAYLDVSDCASYDRSATRIAEAIRADVEKELGITVSAGVSANKFVAKVASDWNKPNGLKVVPPGDIDAFVADLSISAIPGVGRVTAEKLGRMGFKICRDIRHQDPTELTRKLGSFGLTLYERAYGRDDRPVTPDRIRKSISVEQTYSEDLPNGEACLEKLSELITDLLTRVDKANSRDLIQKGFVKIRFNDFSSTTVERSGTTARISDYRELLLEGLERKALPVRLLGIGVRLHPRGPGSGEQLKLNIDDANWS
jgi:DNA polymerase-4